MQEEEREHEAPIRSALSADELASFGRLSVERTSPADQKMMLSFMLPAMPSRAVEEFFGKLPESVAAALRPLASARRGGLTRPD